ncbi:MAG TPA: hypothetical protein PLM22_01350 [Candidatus Sabulitectum sp.]|nr:hypothetical protein [Candidatus Sabulitectum sp.]
MIQTLERKNVEGIREPVVSDDVLTLVSVFHYVYGGFQILLSLIGVLYIVMGILMGTGTLGTAKSPPPPEAMGWIFGAIGVIITVFCLTLGAMSIKAGTNIRRRRNRMFCIVVDAILCLMVPFGTIVGVFGLVMLTRPEAAEEFTG